MRISVLSGILFLLLPQAWLVAQAPAEKPFAWKVSSAQGTAYVVGSIHLAKPDLYPLASSLEEAFAGSAVLGLEMDPTNPAVMQLMLTQGVYPAGDSVESHLSPESLALVQSRLAAAGLSLQQLGRFKVWFLAQTLALTELQRLGYSPTHGIDLYFLNKAKGGKRIAELERPEDQIGFFNSMSDAEQETFLIHTMSELDQTEKHATEIFEAWKAGDADRVEKFVADVSGAAPELQAFHKRLIDDRNVEMAKKIEGYLASNETHFIVIGCAHLVGENGILNLLKKAGYTVEQL